MKKKEFLEKLEKRLSILNEEERNDIINEYKDHIERKILSGMSEEEAVKDFGDFNTLIKDILSAYKINENYEKNNPNKFENTFNIIVDEMVKFFKKLLEIISNKNGEDLLRIICKIILLLVLIWILRIPFWMIKTLGASILNILPGYLDNILSTLWIFLVEISYTIISILMLYNLVKKMIFEEEKNFISDAKVEPTKSNKKIKTELPREKQPPKDYATLFLNPFMTVIKVLIVLISLPLLFSLIGLTIFLGIMLALCLKGVFLVSVYFIIIGFILINYSLLKIIYRIVFKEEQK